MTGTLPEHDICLCPSCGKPMAHVRHIWRALGHTSEVLECRHCGVSVTQAVPREKSKEK